MPALFNKETATYKFSAKLEPDRMKLFVTVEPIGNPTVTRAELVSVVHEFLADTSTVDTGVLDDICKCLAEGKKAEERRIVKGRPPENGADGKLLLVVKKYGGPAEVKVDSRGFADFSERHLFDNIVKGQVVARVYPPKDGTPGVDAMGKPVPAKPGKPIKLSLGKSLRETKSSEKSDPFSVVIADEEGYLNDDNGKLEIRDELVVREDLDFNYGNIDFIGKVKIGNDVLPGFSVIAQKGIQISGGMRGKQLICKAGDIHIKGFAFGGDGGRIVCGGSLTVRVAQELHADVAGEITIEKEAVDCVLAGARGLHMPKGSLIGGVTSVVCGVEAEYVGAQSGAETRIRLCNDIEVSEEYTRLVVDIESHEKAITLVKLHLGPYAAVPMRIEKLQPPHRAKMQQLYDKFKQIEDSRIRLLAKKKTMLETAQQSNCARVSVEKTLYAGTVISAGETVFEVKENIEGPLTLTYLASEKRFEQGAFQNIECQISPVKKQEAAPAALPKGDHGKK